MVQTDEMNAASDIQECFLLPGKRCVRQIFGGRRRADRDGKFSGIAGRFSHFAPGIQDFTVQPRRERRREHPTADLRADDAEPLHVIHVERLERTADAFVKAILREEISIRVRGGREPAGHRDAESRQSGYHFPDGSVFAADQLNVFVLQLLKGNDVRLHSSLLVGR